LTPLGDAINFASDVNGRAAFMTEDVAFEKDAF
jgi:hypothetical protein